MAKKTNRGYEYEQELVTAYRKLNSTGGQVGSGGMDLRFFIKNSPINIEVKFIPKNTPSAAKNLDYGQTAFYQTESGNWQFTEPKTDIAEDRIEILTRAGVLKFINEKWKDKKSTILSRLKSMNFGKNISKQDKAIARKMVEEERLYLGQLSNYGIVDNKAAIKQSEKNIHFVGEEEYPYHNAHALKNAVHSYYSSKGADYVQIKHFGFYRLGNNDPISKLSNGQIKIPLFEPSTVLCRPRLKGYGDGKYAFTVALNAYGFEPTTLQYHEVSETKISENRKNTNKVGRSMVSDLDNIPFLEYIHELNQTQS